MTAPLATGWWLDERPPAACVVVGQARARAHGLITSAKADGYAATLVLAADAFVIRAADGLDVVAGYPWFGSYLGGSSKTSSPSRSRSGLRGEREVDAALPVSRRRWTLL
jgi:hypothetical protein